MKINIIQVPYHLGQQGTGVALGPIHYLQAGVDRNWQDRGFDLNVETVESKDQFEDELSAIVSVNSHLAKYVKDTLVDGGFPLVLAGDCNSCLGTLAGFDDSQIGMIWFDAHGDFNTPKTSPSGFFDGMPVAIAVGHCYKNLWKQMGRSNPIPESNILLIGTRDIDYEERKRLELSEIQVVTTNESKQAGLMTSLLPKLKQLQSQVREIYLHLDIDVLDPQEAPGAGFNCPDGLSVIEVEQAICSIAEHFQIKAAALTNYSPERDQEDRTLNVGLRLIDVITKVKVKHS